MRASSTFVIGDFLDSFTEIAKNHLRHFPVSGSMLTCRKVTDSAFLENSIMDPLVKAALDEFKNLRNDIRQIDMDADARKKPLIDRMSELETFLRIADTIASGNSARSSLPRETAKDKIISATSRMLQGGKIMPVREIVVELERQGIELYGKDINDKVGRVSLILSRENTQFIGKRGVGWKLKSNVVPIESAA